MGGFKRLTDPRKINVTPDRIQIVTVSQTDRLDNIFRRYRIQDAEMETLAVLNNMMLSDQIPKGTLLKIVAKGQKG